MATNHLKNAQEEFERAKKELEVKQQAFLKSQQLLTPEILRLQNQDSSDFPGQQVSGMAQPHGKFMRQAT